ncbi:MAG: hypothetical protein V1904_05520 [Bacteroidota bacterium]
MKQFIICGIKGIFTLVCASLVFVSFLTFFPLAGSLTTKGFPLGHVLIDMINLLLILAGINVPLGFFMGSIAGKLKQKRLLYLSLSGFLFYWLIIVLVILIFSKFTLTSDLFSGIIRLSIWAMLAYSFYAVPFVIAAVFLLEKWTRRK